MSRLSRKKIKLMNNALFFAILFLVTINTALFINLTSTLNSSLAENFEISRPANLEATVIKTNNCSECFDIDAAFQQIKNTNVKIEKEEILNSEEEKAKELIAKYNITKLPTIIFTGEIKKDENIEKAWETIGEIKNEAVIFTKLTPPYFDVLKNKVSGKVKVTYVNDKDCEECISHEGFINQLKKAGVSVVDEETFNYPDEEAKKMIKLYDIKKIPTFILSDELSAYEKIIDDWDEIGKINDDGSYVATQIAAPYRDITSNKIKGLVTATILVDKNCRDCLDTVILQEFLNKLPLTYKEKKVLDISFNEALNLINKYKIETIPTLILDEETAYYPNLKSLWRKVGSIDEDGSYVLDDLSIFKQGTFKNIETGKIVTY